MIHLPDDHNHTSRRYSRTLSEAFADTRAPCIERPRVRAVSRWALFGPLLFAVMALALLNVVKSRHEERQRITAACLEVQDVERGNPAACRYLFTGDR